MKTLTTRNGGKNTPVPIVVNKKNNFFSYF